MAENIIKDFHFLKNSTMSYPTWEKISQMLAVENVAPKAWGGQGNAPLYSVIKKDGVETPCGIDIPILLEPHNKTKDQLIIILGESALRSKEELGKIKAPNNVILGTPYAIHLQECPPKCSVYRKIFDAFLKEGYSLYITDIIKVWWEGKKLVPDDKLDIPIFKEELEIFEERNHIIVAWGKKSQDALQHRMNKKPDTDFLPLPHPGVNNWDSWKLRIFMKAVFNKKLEYATNVYGKCSIGNEKKTDEGIVADEAVRSIIEYLSAVKQK